MRYISPARNYIFFIALCEESFTIWTNILGHYQSFFNHEIFVNPVEKNHRDTFWSLSCQANMIHSNPSDTLDAMNF